MFRIPAHLQRNSQSGIFYFRLTVPEQLRHIVGRREIKRSLRTGRRAEAIVLAQQLYVEARSLFLKVEIGMGKQPKVSAEDILSSLNSLDIKDGFLSKTVIEVAAPGGQKNSITVEHEDPVVEAEMAAKILAAANSQQTVAPTLPSVTKEKGPSLAKTIRDYINEKKRTKEWTPKTTDENEAIFQLLKEVLRNPTAEIISIKHATEFKNTLLKLPPNRTKGKYKGKSVREVLVMRPSKTMSVSTVNKYLRRVSSLFDWGRKHGYVNENPFSGLGIRQKKRAHQERDRYSAEELKILCNTDHLIPSKLRKQYQFWLPLLGIYTGARLGELAQLYLNDVKKVDGVWVLDINGGEDGKRVKTEAGFRLVPLHPVIINLGFLHYVEALRNENKKRVFFELHQRRDGYGQTASKWFARYRKTIGIEKPFHSLRHTFVDELLQKGADKDKVAALVGHVDESTTGGRYGKPFRPGVLLPVVCMLDFDLGGLTTVGSKLVKHLDETSAHPQGIEEYFAFIEGLIGQ